MHVQVDVGQSLAYLADIHDTHGFTVVVTGSREIAAVDAALGAAGSIDPDDEDHARIVTAWVRARMDEHGAPGWTEHFDHLLAHLDRHGGLLDGGGTIHARVQYTSLDE